jgi:hypothetical protein
MSAIRYRVHNGWILRLWAAFSALLALLFPVWWGAATVWVLDRVWVEESIDGGPWERFA